MGGNTAGQDPSALGIGRLFWLTHEAIVVADLDTETVVLWNPSAERIFGYTAEEAQGMPLDTLVPPALEEAHHTGIHRFRDSGVPRLVGGPPVEVPALTKGGDEVMVALTLTALDNSPRRHVLAVIRDVSAQKQAAAEQRRTYEAQRAFVAAASHDLRTPLTTILGFARILRDEPELLTAEERQHLAARTVAAAERASRLVDDLLTLSTIQAGAVETRPEAVALAEVVREVAVALGASIEVEIEVDSRVVVFVDKDHIDRILSNLLANASVYGQPPVVVSAVAEGASVEISVRDAGDGIASDFIDDLFTPFARGVAGKNHPGTGLGLSIVKGLAEANGGHAHYQSGTEGGGRFVVTLPAAT